ncbi:membrane protein DedA, SNARE-associated domain [Candidatus Kryptobacter tengchongensis]|uniref:DedA family protein n=1 Tax=Kryptobacter tengchongensis TaxID=1643429 RepID=UPI0007076530|nr:DedA family protein [Candidatus Kryptobacter tengchongensis]CUS91600.1 membrane protein DedA, SNARE-associated domain [Candidatus Kryptobacter tengchongensis]CUU08219.1 membrane protein DedA, SNARE-associated domain [Candidatus Kryptobacter tengchongensis]
MEELLQKYGYILIFLITLFEGESILLIAGFMAHQGMLDLHTSILSAFLGSTLADQIIFYLMRRNNNFLLKKLKKFDKYYTIAKFYAEKYGSAVVLLARYLYGIRTPLVMIVSLSGINALKFTILNIIAAFVWAISFGYAGFYFGQAAEKFIGDIKRYQFYGWGLIFSIVLILYVISKIRIYQLKKLTGEKR